MARFLIVEMAVLATIDTITSHFHHLKCGSGGDNSNKRAAGPQAPAAPGSANPDKPKPANER
jgi:hypothetical protein